MAGLQNRAQTMTNHTKWFVTLPAKASASNICPILEDTRRQLQMTPLF